MNLFCIKKTTLKKIFFATLFVLVSYFSFQYLSNNSSQTKAVNPSVLTEVQLNPRNYLSEIAALKKGGSYKLIFLGGKYSIPSYTTTNVPVITSNQSYVDVPVKGGILFDQFQEIVIDAKTPSNRPKFFLEKEVGMYFKDISKVTISNVSFYGGMPPKKEPSNNLVSDPFRSQILFRNVKTVSVNNFYLEGVELPDGYQTMSAAGMRGITLLNDSIEGVAYFHNGNIKNIPWDNILLMGKATAQIYDLSLSRNSKQIYDKVVNYPFSGLAGSAVSAFKGAYMTIKNVRMNGFQKLMFLDSSRGASLENIAIGIPPDWDKDYQYSGMWILGVNQTPGTKSRGNLIVNNLSLFPATVSDDWQAKTPTYDFWFGGLNLLQKVELSNLKLAISYRAGDANLTESIAPLFSIAKNDYGRCLMKRTINVTNWEVAGILRWETGGQWKRINYDTNQFKGCGLTFSTPVIHKILLPAYPENSMNGFLSDKHLMSKWAIDYNWPW
jgi:hypothetical protein